MEQTAMLDAAPRTDAEYAAAIDRIIIQMTQVREQMANDQHDIERLQAQTDVLLTKLRAR